MEVDSPAKVNLYLKIIKERKDNYHELITLFERIDLKDKIILEKIPKGFEIICKGRKVPLGKDNLVWQAVFLLSQKTKKDFGIRVKIFKNIPVGGGLGGGSSNAAGVLLGINRLYEIGLDKSRLYRLGSLLGSDVNFFLSETRFALGYGRGEKILPLDIDLSLWHVLIYPGFSISTKKIYGEFRDKGIDLTRRKMDVKILLDALKKGDWEKVRKGLFNSLEEIVMEKYPILGFWRNRLLSSGARGVLVSGSGSSIFGIYRNRKEADKGKEELEGLRRRGVKIFLVSTC